MSSIDSPWLIAKLSSKYKTVRDKSTSALTSLPGWQFKITSHSGLVTFSAFNHVDFASQMGWSWPPEISFSGQIPTMISQLTTHWKCVDAALFHKNIEKIGARAWSTLMAAGSTLARPTDTQLANLPNIFGKTPRRNVLFWDKLPCCPTLRPFPLLTSQADVFCHDSLF